MTKLDVPTEQEGVLARQIQMLVQDHVRRMDRTTIAGALGLLPVGVEVLFGREWTLSQAIRVAEALGVNAPLAVLGREDDEDDEDN